MMTDSNEYGSKCLTNAAGNFLGCKIDQNLTVTQGIMGFINTVDTVDDPILEQQVDKAKWFAGIGSAGPAVVAGTMMIMYRIAMALFIGFAPIFILCLLFKKTAPLFQKWLFYGLATIFSSVLLGIMSDIATDLVTKIATSLFVADRLLSFIGGAGVSGIMEASTQQLGLGLILSTLLITVPPMAGLWFNGMMGNFTPVSPLNTWGVRGSQGMVPPNVDGGRSMQQVEQRVTEARQNMAISTSSGQGGNSYNHAPVVNIPITNPSSVKNTSTDVMRTESQIGQASNISNKSGIGGNTDKTKSNKGDEV